MTMEIVTDLFTNLLSAYDVLGIKNEISSRIEDALPRLLPFKKHIRECAAAASLVLDRYITKLIVYELNYLVFVAKSCPEIDFPTKAPACSAVTSVF